MHAMQLWIYPCNDSIMKHHVWLVLAYSYYLVAIEVWQFWPSWQGRGPAENHVSNRSDRQHKQCMTLYRYWSRVTTNLLMCVHVYAFDATYWLRDWSLEVKCSNVWVEYSYAGLQIRYPASISLEMLVMEIHSLQSCMKHTGTLTL